MARTDDEEEYRRIADELADAIAAAIPAWIVRVGRQRIIDSGLEPTADRIARVQDAAVVAATALEPRVRDVLTADVDAGAGNPLAVLRAGTGPVTEVLRELGVPAAARDDFARRNFPDDVYELAPASFTDVDEALHEPGLVWGVARAHVHLRRRAAGS